MPKKIYNLLKKYWLMCVFFVVPLPCLFWLPKHEIIMHGLFYPWPEKAAQLFNLAYQYLYSWIFGGMGLPNTEPAGFLYYFLMAIFLKIGGSPHFAQTLIFYFGFAGILAGFYFLARTLCLSKSGSLLASVFYLFCPFVFSGMPLESMNFRLIPYYILTPLLWAFFIRAIKTTEFFRELAFFTVVSFFTSMVYSSLQYLFLHLVIIGIYGSYFLFTSSCTKGLVKKLIIRFVLLLGALVLVNFYWLCPLFINLQSSFEQRSEPGFSATHDLDMVMETSAKNIPILMMIPYYQQKFLSPWLMYYYKPMLFIVIFIFLLGIPLALFNKETRKRALFPAIWLLFAIFLVGGLVGPFSFLSKFIFTIHPYFTRLFRNVLYFELLVIPAISLLVGLGVSEFMKKLKFKGLIFLSGFFVFILLVVWGWPFISGAPFASKNKTESAQFGKVPEYFYETASFLNNKAENNRIMTVPEFTFQDSFVAYDWGNVFSGVPSLGLLAGKPFYRPLYPELVGKVDKTLASVLCPDEEKISIKDFNFLASIANIRYLTFHKDTAWQYLHEVNNKKFPLTNGQKIESFLAKNTAIEKVEEFGKIEVFRFKNENYLPLFYVPQKIFFVKNDLSNFEKVFNDPNYQLNSAIYVEEQVDTNLEMINLSKTVAPVLEFKKINPVKYRVVVHGASYSFALIQSESFHHGWKIYLSKMESNKNIPDLENYKILDGNEAEQAISWEAKEYFDHGWLSVGKNKKVSFISKNFNGTIQNQNLSDGYFFETWFKKPVIFDENHVVANIYANSYFLDPANICQNNANCEKNADGSYDFVLTVEFWPQRIFYAGMFVSSFTLLVCCGGLLYLYIKKRKNENT